MKRKLFSAIMLALLLIIGVMHACQKIIFFKKRLW